MDRFKRLSVLFVVSILTAVVAGGCGSQPAGGGSGADDPAGQEPAADDTDDGTDESADDAGAGLALPSPNSRILQPGDRWTYQERQVSTVGGETTARTVGTHVHEVLADAATDEEGNQARILDTTFSGEVNGDAEVVRSARWYFTQVDDGTVYQHGRVNAYVNPPAERTVIWPPEGKYAVFLCPIEVGATQVWDVSFDDGAQLTGQSTVEGVERIVTPAGTFVAARIDVRETEVTAGGTFSWHYILWHAPELGHEVKAEFRLKVGPTADEPEATGYRVRELAEVELAEPETGEGDETEASDEQAEDTAEQADDVDQADDGTATEDQDGAEAEDAGLPPLPAGAELTTTESGLQYYDFEVGSGRQPDDTATVTVDYTGYLEDGTVFDSGEGVQFDLQAVVAGFAEGISTMQEGGRRRLVVPPELGYGAEGNPAAGIGGEDTMVFDVTLHSVDEA